MQGYLNKFRDGHLATHCRGVNEQNLLKMMIFFWKKINDFDHLEFFITNLKKYYFYTEWENLKKKDFDKNNRFHWANDFFEKPF